MRALVYNLNIKLSIFEMRIKVVDLLALCRYEGKIGLFGGLEVGNKVKYLH